MKGLKFCTALIGCFCKNDLKDSLPNKTGNSIIYPQHIFILSLQNLTTVAFFG